eukprot:scaffold10917_cov297-Chaetoceros_neogracile.AAC.1
MFIQESQFSRRPLYVSPDFSSTSMGEFSAALRSDKGNYVRIKNRLVEHVQSNSHQTKSKLQIYFGSQEERFYIPFRSCSKIGKVSRYDCPYDDEARGEVVWYRIVATTRYADISRVFCAQHIGKKRKTPGRKSLNWAEGITREKRNTTRIR